MKKLLLLLLLIPSLLLGQMKITEHKGEDQFGYSIPYKLYESKTPSRDYVIFLHGTGERGPADGSKLYLVEKNTGFPKSAALGFEFPFNIIAPQVEYSYSQLKKYFIPYVKFWYKADHIFVTGLSLGGMATYEFLTQDPYYLIDGAAAVCGSLPVMVNGVNIVVPMKNYRIRAYHGKLDPTVKYSNDVAFINAYNTSHPGYEIKLTTYDTVKHNAWDKAYSLKPGEDDLYQFVLSIFAIPKPNPCPNDEIKEKIINFIQTLK